MRIRRLQIGDVIIVQLPTHQPGGHEQKGIRPAIAVGLPNLLGRPRFPVILEHNRKAHVSKGVGFSVSILIGMCFAS